jgi:phosphoglycolate phosphatase
MIRHILFDLDGTLIDSAPIIIQTLSNVFRNRGIRAAKEIDTKLIGPPLRDIILNLVSCDHYEIVDELVDDFVRHYDEFGYRECLPFDGVESMLSSLHLAGFPLYLVTNKRIRPTLLIIKNLGWEKFFRGVYSRDAFKPQFSTKAEVLDHVVKVHSIPKESSLYIGDRSEDEYSARDSGIEFVAAMWGYANWSTDNIPSRRIDRPMEFRELLKDG